MEVMVAIFLIGTGFLSGFLTGYVIVSESKDNKK
mgnify:CR=1 FL=1